MQQVQQRELPERISWARALIFASGFFLIAAILLGQLPSVVYAEMTSATLEQFEQLCLSLGFVCLGSFAIVQVIVLLFDPKPLVRPVIFTVLGVILAAAGFALSLWAPAINISLLVRPTGILFLEEMSSGSSHMLLIS